MNKHMLGSGLEVSALGLGCLGSSTNDGAVVDREAGDRAHPGCGRSKHSLLRHRQDVPFTNEELVGETLAPKCDDIVTATKSGFSVVRDTVREVDSTAGLNTLSRSSTRRAGASRRTGSIRSTSKHRADPNVPSKTVA
jgi:aryl-alcohol dehydrogenase-like predicted oxidoreductase